VSAPAPAGPCVDENDLLEFAEGLLPSAQRDAVERHLDGCARCRSAVADLARLGETLPALRSTGVSGFEAGTRIVDRYVVERPLGSGAMGLVYEAWDAQLQRRVALKFLKSGVADEREAQRMVREAQALARVTHPNVVVVHDYGAHDGLVYVAMELVRGVTLRAWQAGKPWREVVAMYQQAGAGLAAAHRAGVVHRDFKPENVLVSDDGRARVVDFGIAQLRGEAGAPGTDGPQDVQPTATHSFAGGLVGTPAYMSPEQLRGERSDARSDQFAFCVALYEALTGERPFTGTSLAELRAVVERGVPTPVAGTRVRAAVLKALRRGLENDPAQRWPDVETLLRALDSASRRRTPRVAGALAAVALGALFLGLGLWHRSTRCTGAAEEIDGAWNDAVKASTHAAFVASGSPLAEPTFSRVVPLTEAWRAAWVQITTAACRATRVDGSQPDAVFEARRACLARQLERFSATTQVWRSADLRTVADAVTSVKALPSPEDCSEAAVARAGAQVPASEALRREVDRLRPQVATAAALAVTGRGDEAARQLEALWPDVARTQWQPLLAEAAIARSRAAIRRSRLSEAERFALDAVDAAERSGDALALAHARLLAFEVVGVRLQRLNDMRLLHRSAAVAIERAGDSRALRASLAELRADAESGLGRPVEAREAALEAIALREQLGGKDDPALAPALVSLARVGFYDSGLGAGWEAHLERAIALQTRALGERHPDLARSLRFRAVLTFRDKRGDGREDAERAVAIVQESLGESIELAEALGSLGQLHFEHRDIAAARKSLEAAVALEEKLLEPNHPLHLQTLNNLANAMLYDGQPRFDDAFNLRTRLLALADATFGRESGKRAIMFINWCAGAANAGRAREVVQRCEDEAAHVEGLVPRVVQTVWRRIRARVLLGAGRGAEARALLGAMPDDPEPFVTEAYLHMVDAMEGVPGARTWLQQRAVRAHAAGDAERLLAAELDAFLAQGAGR
jgi:serine/threonine-protein kinase